jgi:signal transduction histidine kinase/ActR/RegA family two-component response regulator
MRGERGASGGLTAGGFSPRAWRERLLERVLWTLVPLATVAYFLAVATAGDRRTRLIEILTGPIVACWAAALARRWSFRLRGTILIVAMLIVSYTAYWLSGFQGNGAMVAAFAIVASGMLFGPRAMLFVLLLALAAPIGAASLTLHGLTPRPPTELVSPERVGPWVRTTFVAFTMWALLGVAVTYVVAHIERAVEKEHGAMLELRAEQARREEAESQRLEAERTALQAQKLELVGSLAAGVAHDFNNVLAVVQGWASLGLRADADERTRSEAAEALDGAARQGAALAQQLLALGRRTVRSVRPCRVADVVGATAMALRRVLPDDVELVVDEAGDAWIDADEAELQQLVFNLVINARDAMPTGGRLHVTTGLDSWKTPRAVAGGELPPGEWAYLAVSDTGTGIPPEVEAHVFEPFFTTKPTGSGTGLGLWTVLGIAKAAGGGVLLESESGAGTTFHVYFPARPMGAPQAPKRVAAPSSASRRPARILLLEDNEPVRRLVRDLLVGRGDEVLAVKNGDEALEALRGARTPFDLLCTDAVVPNAPAREVIAAFEQTRPAAPVLILSGYVDEELTRRGIEQGRYRLLRKPFRSEDLAAAIDELLGTALGPAAPDDKRPGAGLRRP